MNSFVSAYAEALRADTAAIFAGAGLSIPAGFVDWKTLLKEIAQDIGLDVDKENDLLSVAQYHTNERGGRNRINQALITAFAERSRVTENHVVLSRLPIRTYWTTNYDNLIEEALRRQHKRPDVKRCDKDLSVTLPQRDAVVYKMHGDISRFDEAVVTRDDYEAYAKQHPVFCSALQGDLVSKTFLFIGFSFSDPNINFMLGQIRVLLGADRREHFCLLRRVQPGDFESTEQYAYARALQDLQVRDLRRYGIQGLLTDSYLEYTDVLRRVALRFRRTRVFVSGAAADYSPFTTTEGQEFFRQLGASLIAAKFDIINGFGLGAGPYLLNGALEGLEQEGTASLHNRVVLRPFPQGVRDEQTRALRWRSYREGMIAEAGIAIFAFGNRSNGTSVELSSGVREEFEIALTAGVLPIPLGFTGHMAHLLHQEVMSRFDELYPGRPSLRSSFEALGQRCTPGELIARTVSLVTLISKEL